MKEEIIVRYKDDRKKEEASIIERFNRECRRLGTFYDDWKKRGSVIYWNSTFANDYLFIRLGGLQKALLDIAYFQLGYNGISGLNLCLEVGRTWEDVLDRMAEIESIAV